MSILEQNPVTVRSDGAVYTFTITRPESLNALNPDVLQSIILELEKVDKIQIEVPL